ncbi:MAG: N-acetyltransferase [Verrucomicrobiota bacterium]
MTTIRTEEPRDAAAIRALNEKVFGRRDEADLIERLREDCPGLLSMVAEQEGKLVGHVLFSPVVLETPGEKDDLLGMGLAPLAVNSRRRGEGIGRKLVENALLVLQVRGCNFVVVLGDPDYYGRFGFEPAENHGITCQWKGVPEGAFQIILLNTSVLGNSRGRARYRREFSELA